MTPGMRARALVAAILAGGGACSGEIVDYGGFPDGGVPVGRDASLPHDAPLTTDGSLAPGPSLGAFKLTYYYVAEEASYLDGGPDDTGLYDTSCNLLAMVPSAFERAVAIEGTGQLSDGRVFNYSGSCSCPTSPCYHFVDAQHPWGSGFGDRPLVPFRSVAVDRAVLTIGRGYWVEELAGTQMPGDPPLGGWIHDGCVSADDTGGSIDGMHIDFFSALRAYYRALDLQLGLSTITLHEGGSLCP